MVWETLTKVRIATFLEFTQELAKRHHFVKLPSGRWCRTLDAPVGANLKHIQGNVWHML